MASPIKYTNIYLYSTDNADSSLFRVFLDTSFVKYVPLNYTDVADKEINLSALSTWFDDTQTPPQKVQFSVFPILVFDKLYWESDDGTESLTKRAFAQCSNDLPADFITKADKVV